MEKLQKNFPRSSYEFRVCFEDLKLVTAQIVVFLVSAKGKDIVTVCIDSGR